jgi:hypothetical protein
MSADMTEVLSRGCPVCGAEPGDACAQTARGETVVHFERKTAEARSRVLGGRHRGTDNLFRRRMWVSIDEILRKD